VRRPTAGTRPGLPRPPVLEARVIELGDPDWCWSHLVTATHGVLTSPGSPGTAGHDVTYAVVDRELVVAARKDGRVLQLLAGSEVELDLTGRADDGVRWVVRATGLAEPTFLRGAAASPAGSGNGRPARQVPVDALLVPAFRLRGYREAPLEDPG
jgi:hypothetical protein